MLTRTPGRLASQVVPAGADDLLTEFRERYDLSADADSRPEYDPYGRESSAGRTAAGAHRDDERHRADGDPRRR